MTHRAYKNIIAYLLSAIMIIQGAFSGNFMYVNATEIISEGIPQVNVEEGPQNGSAVIDGENTLMLSFDSTNYDKVNYDYKLVYRDDGQAWKEYNAVQGIDINFGSEYNRYTIEAAVRRTSKADSSDIVYGNTSWFNYTERLPALDDLGISPIGWTTDESNVSGIYLSAILNDIGDYTANWGNYSYSNVYYRWGYVDSNNSCIWIYDTENGEKAYPDNLSEDDSITLHGKYRTCLEAYIYKGEDGNKVRVSSDILKGEESSFDSQAPKVKSLYLTTKLAGVGSIFTKDWHTKDYYYSIYIEEEGNGSSGLKNVVIQPYLGNQKCDKRWEYTYTEGEIVYTYWEEISFAEFKDNDGNYIDGEYNILISVEDRAGNKYSRWIIPSNSNVPTLEGEKSEDFSFKMDNIKPIVAFTGDVIDGGYYNTEESNLSVTATDERSGINTYEIAVTRNEIPYENSIITGEKVTDKKWKSSGVFSEEGEYEVNVTATDRAGNVGVVVNKDKKGKETFSDSVIKFIIDKTVPTVNIIDGEGEDILETDDARKEYNVNNQEIDFVVTDSYVNYDKCTITIDKYDNDDCEKSTLERTIINPEKDDDYQWEVDGARGTFSYKFTSQGVYKIKIHTEDKAGNETEENVIIVIDTKAPSTTITLQKSENGTEYYKTNVTIDINIKDSICNSCISKYEITRTYNETKSTYKLKDIKAKERDYSTEQLFTEEGLYTVKLITTDEAGNEKESNEITFIIDKTRPVITIDSQDVTNGGEVNTDVTLDFTSIEANDGEYQITIERENEGHTYTNGSVYSALTWTKDDDVLYKKNASHTLSEEGVYRITFEATDRAGNEAIGEEYVFIIDKTAPVISNIRYTDTLGDIAPKFVENNIYSNRYITVYFEVDDNIVGVDNVYYSIGVDNKTKIDRNNSYKAVHVKDNIYSILVPESFGISEFDNIIGIWAEDILGNISSNVLSYNMIYNTAYADITMTADKEYDKWLSEDVTFDIRVTDKKSGIDSIVYKVNGKVVKEITFNKVVYDYSCNITASENAPTKNGYDVEVIVTNNAGSVNNSLRRVYIDKVAPVLNITGYQEQEHISADKYIDFHIADVAYDETIGRIVASRTIDGITTLYSVENLYPQSADDVITRNFSLEGYYSVYFVATDGAGNESISNTIHFTVDKTAPQLSISGTTNNSVNQGEVPLTFTCVESFYMTNSVNISVVRELDGQRTTSNINGFSHIGKVSSLTNTFTEDGTYTVTFEAVDMAGNKAITQTISFTIDKTAPELSFTGVTNYLVTNSAVTLSSNVIESYFTGNRITITGTRTDIYGNVYELQRQEYTGSNKDSSRQTVFSEDGIYHIIMSAKDEAGNEAEKEIHFTIDTTPPQILYVEEIDGQYFSTFEFAHPMSEMILDISVVTYGIYINGIEYDGRTPIEVDGKYSLYIKVEDEVGYTSEANAEFIVDHTPPKTIIDGIEDGDIVHKNGQMTVSLVDQDDRFDSIMVNGKEISLSGDSKSYTLVYGEYGKYVVDVKCSDKAGNITEENITFYYTNFFTDMFVIMGLIVFILGVGGTLYIVTKKKHKGWD